jgi:hypothetical protein
MCQDVSHQVGWSWLDGAAETINLARAAPQQALSLGCQYYNNTQPVGCGLTEIAGVAGAPFIC